ncbi:MAG TPA: hypothetical protein VF129_05600 [Actinomycetota bacterium]
MDGVRLFSPLGRILYAEQSKVMGTRPSYLRDLTFRVAGGDVQRLVRGGKLLTYVPVWLTPGGPVAVAELSQPLGSLQSEAIGPCSSSNVRLPNGRSTSSKRTSTPSRSG